MTIDNKSIKFKYCTSHGEMVAVWDSDDPYAEAFHVYEETLSDVIGTTTEERVCFGEFAECPPPELSEDWWDYVFGLEESSNASDIF